MDENTEEEVVEEQSILDLPDDDVADFPEVVANIESKLGDAQDTGDSDTGSEAPDETPEASSGKDEVDEETAPVADSQAFTDDKDKDTPTLDAGTEETNISTNEDINIDYKAEYEKLLSPFKANGKKTQINTVDDAISLMQMGANYNKKMTALKPHLKLLKMLDKNELLEESKINYLIDLAGKNPAAISQLLRESEIDPMEMDLTSEDNYQPNNHAVDDRELALDEALGRIETTPSYMTTLNIISERWDEKSRNFLYENPQLIEKINDQVGAGLYDQITSIIENERMLGRLTNLSDIEAYKHVGDSLVRQQQLTKEQPSSSGSASSQTQSSVNKGNVNKELSERRAAASNTRGTGSKPKSNEFNPLALSDEEFSKLSVN